LDDCIFAIAKEKNTLNADVAQLVERNLAKVEVAGSSLVIRSKAFFGRLFYFVPGQFSTVNAPMPAKIVACQNGIVRIFFITLRF
jgi:hypothetical protein